MPADPSNPFNPATAPVKPPSTPPWEEGAERRHLAILDAWRSFAHTCHDIHRLLTQHAPRETHGLARTLGVNPWHVTRNGYHYLRVWATSSTSITVDAGAGPTALTLNAGWNNVDWPEGTTVTGSGNIFVEWTDYYPPAQ